MRKMAKTTLTEKFLKFEDAKLSELKFVHQEGGLLFTITIKRGDKMNSLKEKGTEAERAVYETHPEREDKSQLKLDEGKKMGPRAVK